MTYKYVEFTVVIWEDKKGLSQTEINAKIEITPQLFWDLGQWAIETSNLGLSAST